MNDLKRIALQFIADQYGVSLRELTVGKIEDFIEQEREKPIRKKEAKKELLKEKETENIINNSLVQNPSNRQTLLLKRTMRTSSKVFGRSTQGSKERRMPSGITSQRERRMYPYRPFLTDSMPTMPTSSETRSKSVM